VSVPCFVFSFAMITLLWEQIWEILKVDLMVVAVMLSLDLLVVALMSSLKALRPM